MQLGHSRGRRIRRTYAIISAATLILITALLLSLYPPWRWGQSNVRPELSILQVSSRDIPLYGLLEIDLNTSSFFKNPFDPEEVNITAVISAPSGDVIQIPAFYYMNYSRELGGGGEALTPMGGSYWKVRFSPKEIGDYVVHLTLRGGGETITSENMTFHVRPSDNLGFVGLSQGDGRYLQFSNNRSSFFIGQDVCWFGSNGTYDYDQWFSAMNLSGESITRIWMAPWAFGIEWKQLGYYDLAEAWRLDYVLKEAEEKGIYVILCLMNHGQLQSSADGEWNDNPYNTAKGGPLGRPEGFWTDKTAMALFERRLRYVVARWGYSTHILAWELWNEVENTDNYDFTVVAQWHDVMARYLRSIDPYGHLVTTSSDQRFGSLDALSIVTVHRYGPDSFRDIAGEVPDIIENLWTRYGKPVLITEFGADWRWFGDPYTYKDKEGVEIHEGIWSSVLSGSPSSAMLWWWDSYVQPYNLYYHFKALSAYLRGIDPVRARFKALQARLVLSPAGSKADLTNLTLYPLLDWAKPEANLFQVNADGTVGNVSQFCFYIQGRAHLDLRNNPTFLVNFPFGGDVLVHVNSVADSGAILEIYDNDSKIEALPLPDRDHKNDAFVNEYNTTVSVSLSPGTHKVKLDNPGGDWLSIDYVKFTDVVLRRAKARILGLNNGTLALVWVQNRDHTWWNVVNGMTIEPLKNVTMELSGFRDGEYVVEWWDTYSGAIIKRENIVVSRGSFHITIGHLEKDLALKIYAER
jgi:hypothetical protein